MNRKHIYDAIDRERIYQDEKYPPHNGHNVGAWLTIIRGELQEAEHAWLKSKSKEDLKEILQIASVCVACLEQWGVEERNECKQERQ